MISFLTVLVHLLLAATGSGESGRVVISPSAPRVGDRVTVAYQTTDAPAGFREANEVTLEVYTADKQVYPEGVLRQYPMARSGKDWNASFVIADTQANALCFRFTSGDLVDDNNDNIWFAMVYGKDGRPVRSAHFSVSWLYGFGIGSFRRERNLQLNLKELSDELSLYPDNFSAAQWKWIQMMPPGTNDSVRAIVHREIDEFSARARGSDSLMSDYPQLYEQAGDSARAREIRKEGTVQNEHGFVAFEARLNEARTGPDFHRRIRLLQEVLRDFPRIPPERTQLARQFLIYYASKAEEFDAALEAIKNLSPPSRSLYDNIARGMLKRGERLEEAEYAAAKGVELSKNPDPKMRRNYKTEKEWRESILDSRASSLQILGDIYVKRGKLDSAVATFGEAYALSRGEDPDIAQRYVVALGGAGKYGKAVDIGMETVTNAQETDSLIAEVKHSFAVMHGATSFDQLPQRKKEEFAHKLERAHGQKSTAMRLKVLKTRVSRPTVDFTLRDLDGKSVRLSTLRGNVVIMDFWATWCGPCRESFPILQRVCDKYRENPAVVIVAIDCFETQPDSAAIVKMVRQFLTGNNYTWQVLVDGKGDVAAKYGVTGIPAKFVIDRTGNVAFKSIGFSGPDMEEELIQQIEILLAEHPAGPGD
jgi:thiol-disulfide isomerase/thioredoxin